MIPSIHAPSALAGAACAALVLGLAGALPPSPGQSSGKLRRAPVLTPEAMEILAHLSIVQLPDGNGGTLKTIRLTAADLQLVSGLGATNGYPPDPLETAPTATRTNGLGNLVLGYQEVAGIEPVPFRTGSHFLVLGQGQGYTSFGGLLGGRGNEVAAPHGSIAAGEGNAVTGAFAAVLGGAENAAGPGAWSAIGGGLQNVATGPHAWVAGGILGTAAGEHSAVAGGLSRSAPGRHDWAAGSLFQDQ